MQMLDLNIKQINEKVKKEGYRGWSFEYESAAKRYCLSIFDAHNPEDELVFYLNAFDPRVISHAIRFKKDGAENTVEKKHSYYVKAEEIIAKFI